VSESTRILFVSDSPRLTRYRVRLLCLRAPMIGDWLWSKPAASGAFWFSCHELVAWRHMNFEADVGARPLHLQGRFRPSTCQRWGDVRALKRVARAAATQHYFARRAKRAIQDRVPRLPLRVAVQEAESSPSSLVSPEAVENDLPRPEPVLEPAVPSLGRSTVARYRGGKAAEGMLALCPTFFRKAEQRAAPSFYADMTDDGRLTAWGAVSRFPWSCSWRQRIAGVQARALDLFPRWKSVVVWSLLVCDILAWMFEDISPVFRRVRAEFSRSHGDVFSLVPLRGRYGWRRRARFAGLSVRK
jgi:hypothetical protein